MAAQVLADHAPQAADRPAALALARRLGYLPLALRIAGMHLRNMGMGSSFRAYQHALDHASTGLDGDPHQAQPGGGAAAMAQARPLLWLLACYMPASRIPEQIITGSGPSPWPPQWQLGVPHPLARLLDPRQAMPATVLAGHCRAGLRELCSAGLIQISKSSGGANVIEVHTAIAEAARAAMDTRSQPPEAPDTSLIRETAASAICAMVKNLDTGSADHWPHFRVLTRHIDELLLTTAPHLSPRACRNLLHCMVLCAASYVWSKAEQLAEQLTAKAMTRASELGCHDQDVYQRLRHVHAQARREQGWAAEAEQTFQDILARQLRLKDAAVRLDTLRTRQQLAWTKGRLGKWADAEAGLREVIRLQDQRRLQLGEERADTILRLHPQCMIHWSVGRQGRWAEAELGYRQLVIDREEILGPDHPDTLDAGTVGGHLVQARAAEHESHHTKTDRAKALGELHPDTLLARQLEHYANGYQAWQAGDRRSRRSAIAGLETVLAVQREKRGGNHRETLETRALLTALRGEYSPGMMWPEDLPRPGTD